MIDKIIEYMNKHPRFSLYTLTYAIAVLMVIIGWFARSNVWVAIGTGIFAGQSLAAYQVMKEFHAKQQALSDILTEYTGLLSEYKVRAQNFSDEVKSLQALRKRTLQRLEDVMTKYQLDDNCRDELRNAFLREVDGSEEFIDE